MIEKAVKNLRFTGKHTWTPNGYTKINPYPVQWVYLIALSHYY